MLTTKPTIWCVFLSNLYQTNCGGIGCHPYSKSSQSLITTALNFNLLYHNLFSSKLTCLVKAKFIIYLVKALGQMVNPNNMDKSSFFCFDAIIRSIAS